MQVNNDFLKPKGDVRKLFVYKKAECIYDITYHFAHRFLRVGDRTIDQMIQAARSGKQNILEGLRNSQTSAESGIKLVNIAKGSFEELLDDYDDYRRTRNISDWTADEYEITRKFCISHQDSETYRRMAPNKTERTLVNLAITLIHQEIRMLVGLLERLKQDFLQNGGIKEEMYRARKAYRDRQNSTPSAHPAPPTPPAHPIPPAHPVPPIR